MKFDFLSIFRKSVEKNSSFMKITTTVNEDQYTFLIISRSVLIMRNISNESCRENQNTYFVFSDFFLILKIVPFMR